MTTTTAPRTYPTLEAAARAWGAEHRVTGRTGGYLYADDRAAYNALPRMLRLGRGDQRERLALVGTGGTGPSGTRAVQGWHSLGQVLQRMGRITVSTGDKGPRYAPVLPAVTAVEAPARAVTTVDDCLDALAGVDMPTPGSGEFRAAPAADQSAAATRERWAANLTDDELREHHRMEHVRPIALGDAVRTELARRATSTTTTTTTTVTITPRPGGWQGVCPHHGASAWTAERPAEQRRCSRVAQMHAPACGRMLTFEPRPPMAPFHATTVHLPARQVGG